MKKPAGRTPSQVERLTVRLNLLGRLVEIGTLAWSRQERRAYFEYNPAFLEAPLPLSPFNLPTSSGLKAAPYQPFDGLHGAFNDSLPDGWGRLLLDQRLQKQGYDHRTLGPLERLAYVGSAGMGALQYAPDKAFENSAGGTVDLDWLASQAEQVQREVRTADVDSLQQMQGSSAGARPKIMIGLDTAKDIIVPDYGTGLPAQYEPWMVKFRSKNDSEEIGAEEYAYALMSSDAGVEVPTSRLLKTRTGSYFAVHRFDRLPEGSMHIHTASGLLEADHRMPAIDYDTLLRATRVLTRDERHVRQMFRRMVFNVLAHNRDDHSKNHAFQMGADGSWRPTPAYDLTLSDGPAGEHSLAIAGEGKKPGHAHISKVAADASIPKAEAAAIREAVRASIAKWPEHASSAGLSRQRTSEIGTLLERQAHA
ncbi:MAG: type II toxin-antitoxin system HipA family toxin [Alphaproteobacteria bacterium]